MSKSRTVWGFQDLGENQPDSPSRSLENNISEGTLSILLLAFPTVRWINVPCWSHSGGDNFLYYFWQTNINSLKNFHDWCRIGEHLTRRKMWLGVRPHVQWCKFTTKIGMGTDLKGNTSHNVVMSFHSPSICVTVSPHRPWIQGFILLFTISESQKIYKGFLSPRTQVPSMRPLTADDPHCGTHKIWNSQRSPCSTGCLQDNAQPTEHPPILEYSQKWTF